MAEHGTPDLISSQAPFIQALVQKSVTAITKLAGRLSFRMLRDTRQLRKGPITKSWNQGCWTGNFTTETRDTNQNSKVRMQNESLDFCILTLYALFPMQSYFPGCGRLAGGTIPFMRRYSTICP